MQVIIDQLNQALKVVQEHHKKQTDKHQVLDQWEAGQREREADYKKRLSSLQEREGLLANFGNLSIYRNETEALRKQLHADQDAHKILKDKFDRFVLEETAKIDHLRASNMAESSRLKALSESQAETAKALAQKEKDIEQEVEKRVSHVMSKMRKE